MAAELTLATISKITEAETRIIHKDEPVTEGPTAKALAHAGKKIDSNVLHDITEGEKNVTRQARPVAGGPTAVAQSTLAKCANGHDCTNEEHHTGKLDPETISKITEAEKKFTRAVAGVVAGGPTAMAQKHAGEQINSEVLRDITGGEKKITHQARPVAEGPTAVAQSELAKSRI